MRARATILALGVLAASGAARAQDPGSTLDARALCGLLDTRPGEPVKAGYHGEEMKDLLGDVSSGAACTVTLRDVPNSTVTLTLLGLPRGSELGCTVMDRARGKLVGEGMTARPSRFRYGIRGVLFREVPPENSMLPLGMVALLACDGDFVFIGIAGSEARTAADLDDEVLILRERIRRSLGGVIEALGKAPTLASSEKDFLKEIFPKGKDFYARWRGGNTDCLTGLDYRHCGEEEANDAFGDALSKYADADPRMQGILALADWRYPSGELVAPSIQPVLPVLQRLAEKARSDPSAGVALQRFVAMAARMDAEAAGSDPAPMP